MTHERTGNNILIMAMMMQRVHLQLSASARIMVHINEFFGLCLRVKYDKKELASLCFSVLGCMKIKKNI